MPELTPFLELGAGFPQRCVRGIRTVGWEVGVSAAVTNPDQDYAELQKVSF